MNLQSIEAIVGVFVILGGIALAFLAMQVSGLTFDAHKETYKVYAQFDDLGGLSVRGRVTIAGVTVGKVNSVGLDEKGYRALVELEIYKTVDNLTADTVAAIQTSGLLGEKYIALSIGGDPDILGDGDTIFDTQSALNLEKLISAFASSRGSL